MMITSPLSVFDFVTPHDLNGLTLKYPWLDNFKNNRFSSIGVDDSRELVNYSIENDSGGGADMWRGRAYLMFGCIAKCLIQLRNDYGVKINYHVLHHSISYSGMCDIHADERLNSISRDAINNYVMDMPGALGSHRSMKLHGYLAMQFSTWLTTMINAIKLNFIRFARDTILSHNGLDSILSENTESKIIHPPTLIEWLIEMGVDSSEIALRATLTQRRGMLEYEMGV